MLNWPACSTNTTATATELSTKKNSIIWCVGGHCFIIIIVSHASFLFCATLCCNNLDANLSRKSNFVVAAYQPIPTTTPLLNSHHNPNKSMALRYGIICGIIYHIRHLKFVKVHCAYTVYIRLNCLQCISLLLDIQAGPRPRAARHRRFTVLGGHRPR